MELKSVVEYTDRGLKIAQPLENEKHLVYVRPGDNIELDFSDQDLAFYLVDGDVIVNSPQGGQLVFLQLGSLALNLDDAPTLIASAGDKIDILSRVEVSPLIDQEKDITDKFLELQAASEKHEVEEESLARQRELLEETLESIEQYVSQVSESAVAGPNDTDQSDGEQRSGDLSTVEFVQQTVSQEVRSSEATSIPEPQQIDVDSQSQTQSGEGEVDRVEQLPQLPVLNFSLNNAEVLHVAQRVTAVPGNPATTTILGGSGSLQGAVSPNLPDRIANETLGDTGSSSNQTIQTENNLFFNGSTAAQVISLNPSAPDGFDVQTISINGFPAGSIIYANDGTSSTPILNTALSPGADLTFQRITAGDTPSDTSISFLSNTDISFIIVYPQAQATTVPFSLTVNATATFNPSSGFDAPNVTTLTAQNTLSGIVQQQVVSATDLATADLVLSSVPTTNEVTTGSGDDTIFGGSVVDIINGGDGNDIFTTFEGQDTVDGGGGSDTLYYGIDGNFGYLPTTIGALNGVVIDMANPTANGSVAVAVGTGPDIDAIRNVENIVASFGNDTIRGDAADNTFRGLAGDDSLSGGLGNDTLDGGDGIDVVDFRDSATAISANISMTSNTSFSAGAINAASSTGQGTDSLIGIENIIGSSLADIIIGDAAANTISGSGGNDTILAGGGVDIIDADGELLRDLNNNGDTNDPLETAIAGNQDTIDYSWLPANMGGVDVNLSQQTGNNVTYLADTNTPGSVDQSGGTVSNFENIRGSQNNDVLTGDAGDNVFFASSGLDVIAGGDGTDTLDFSNNTITSSDDVFGDSTITSNIDLNNGSYTISASDGTTIAESTNVSNIENVIGTDGNDVISTSRNLIGNSTVISGGGNDTINASAGNNSIDGGTGIDTVNYLAFTATDAINVNLNTNIVDKETSGSDTLTSIENVTGTTNNDSFIGNAQANTFDGLGGNDTFNYSTSSSLTENNDTFMGGDGIDTVDFSSLAIPTGTRPSNQVVTDTILGNTVTTTLLDFNQNGIAVNLSNPDASGNSSVSVLSNTLALNGIEEIIGTGNGDILIGDTSSNTLIGNNGNDYLLGLSGSDSLSGGAGNDTLSGGAGNDILDGGVGQDWLIYNTSTSAINVNLQTSTVSSDGFGSIDTITGFENVLGGDFNDDITSASASTIVGGLGNDTVRVGVGATGTFSFYGDNVATLTDQTLMHQVDNTVNNNDVVDFSNSSQPLFVDLTSPLNQFLLGSRVDANGDGIFTDADITSPTGFAFGFESVTGTASNDILIGDLNNNILNGGDGDDTINGGAGNDTLRGGNGNDTLDLSASSEAQRIDLSSTVNQTTAFLTQDSYLGFENVNTGGNVDSIIGSSSDNIIFSGAGNDDISGSLGQDTIDGGTGVDQLSYALLNTAITANFATAPTNLQINGSTQTFSNIENLTTSQGNDTLTLGSNLMFVDGSAGNDTFNLQNAQGTVGVVLADGGTGTDTASFAQSIGQVTISAGGSTNALGISVSGSRYDIQDFETLILSNQNDTVQSIANFGSSLNIQSGQGNDTITGGSNNDTLDSGSGNDMIFASLGSDAIEGGIGTDTLSYANLTSTSTVALTAGASQVTVAGTNAFTDMLTNVESLVLGGGSDSINISGINGLGTVDAGGGQDSVSFASAVTTTDGANFSIASSNINLVNVENFNGSAQADTLDFGNISTGITVVGGDGNDTITGSSAQDILEGGAGSDIINAGGGGGTIFGGTADGDTITGSAMGGVGLLDTLSYSTPSFSSTTPTTSNFTATLDANTGTISDGIGTDTVNQAQGAIENFVFGSGNDIVNVDIDLINAAVDSGINQIDTGLNSALSPTNNGDEIRLTGDLVGGGATSINSSGIGANFTATMFQNIEILDLTDVTTNGNNNLQLDAEFLRNWTQDAATGTDGNTRVLNIFVDADTTLSFGSNATPPAGTGSDFYFYEDVGGTASNSLIGDLVNPTFLGNLDGTLTGNIPTGTNSPAGAPANTTSGTVTLTANDQYSLTYTESGQDGLAIIITAMA